VSPVIPLAPLPPPAAPVGPLITASPPPVRLFEKSKIGIFEIFEIFAGKISEIKGARSI
jgi:hypothetical protein